MEQAGAAKRKEVERLQKEVWVGPQAEITDRISVPFHTSYRVITNLQVEQYKAAEHEALVAASLSEELALKLDGDLSSVRQVNGG